MLYLLCAYYIFWLIALRVNKFEQGSLTLLMDVKCCVCYRNIPEDQRVIDPKRGPIKKTAAVKNLPKLDKSGSETARF